MHLLLLLLLFVGRAGWVGKEGGGVGKMNRQKADPTLSFVQAATSTTNFQPARELPTHLRQLCAGRHILPQKALQICQLSGNSVAACPQRRQAGGEVLGAARGRLQVVDRGWGWGGKEKRQHSIFC